MGWLKKFIYKKVLSEWVPFSWIDGHKKQIARWAAFISAVLMAGEAYLPEYTIFDMLNNQLLAILSLLGISLAEAHDEAKEEGNFGVK